MSKICLIRPPALIVSDALTSHSGVPPLSIAYLDSYIRKKGHHSQIIDAIGESLDQFNHLLKFNKSIAIYYQGLSITEIVERIDKDRDFIGISCMFSNEWLLIKKLIDEVKNKFTDIPIFWEENMQQLCGKKFLAHQKMLMFVS